MNPITATKTQETAMRALEKLPGLSPTAGQLLGALGQAIPDVRRLEQLINKDPALAGTLLSVANSAMFARYSETSSTMEAISRIGYSKLKRFALAQTFARVFRFGRPAPVWSPTRFHLHSSATGLAAELIAQNLPVPGNEDAYLAGLLHDLGKLLIAVAFPEAWTRIDSFALHGGAPIEKERELLGVDHAELSAMAALKWKLPERVAEAIRLHHSPQIESGGSLPLSRVIQSANAFTNSLGITVLDLKPDTEPFLPAFNGYALDRERFASDFQSEWETLSSLCFT